MRKFERLALSGVIGMTALQRQEHIAYYRMRAQELRELSHWTRHPGLGDVVSTKIVANDRMMAILEERLPDTISMH